MNVNRKIVFFGGVGSPMDFGGELSKNKEIINRIKSFGNEPIVIDSNKASKSIIRIIRIFVKFFLCVLLHPKATFVFSTSYKNVYPLFKILYYTGIRLNIVYWAIGGNIADRIKQGAYKRRFVNLIDLFVVEGIKMKRDLSELGYNNVWYLPNFKSIGRLPLINKIDDGKIHFLFISRIIPEKGCRRIFDSVRKLNQEGLANRFVVDFYGTIDKEYCAEFNKSVSELDNVNYVGELLLQDERNYGVLARYHYMLFPTYWYGEGFPGVVIDAYKAGVPVIASDFSLNSEFVINGVTGFVIPCDDYCVLSNIMHNAIEGKYDCYAMSVNCQGQVVKYDSSVVIDRSFMNVLSNVNHRKCLKARIRRWLKHNNTLYHLKFKYTDKDYLKNAELMKTSTVKSKSQIAQEMEMYQQYWHCPSFYYVRYELYDKLISNDEILDYIPTSYFYNDFMEKEYAGVKENLYRDKLNLYSAFKQCGIPTPEILAVCYNGNVSNLAGKGLTTDELFSKFNTLKKYFFKPIDGAGGAGILVLEDVTKDGLDLLLGKLVAKSVYVVQEGIIQRSDFMEINPSSVNTLRVITQYRDGRALVKACAIRVGRANSNVDNSSQGGVSCEIDIETGKMSKYAGREHGGGQYDKHPDTGFVFDGAEIMNWENIRSTVEQYALNFPELKDIGWDIAVTPNGILVIEMNLGFGIEHLQCTCKGMRRRLGVMS